MGHVDGFAVPVEHSGEAARLTSRLHAEGWAAHVSVEWLVRGWDQLADEVADYPMTIDDYTNDLTGRDALELVSTWASAPFAAVLRERISSADGRFEASTADDNGVAVSRYFRIDNRSGWWWRRRPTGGPLGAYLDRP